MLHRDIERVFSIEPNAKERFGHAGSEEFWIWLNSEGLQKYPELKKALASFPDKALMTIVSGMESETEFGVSGSSIYRSLTKIISDQGHQWQDFKRVLDFACGCGRVTRLLLKHSHECAIHGSDVNGAHIAWLEKNLSFGSFMRNETLPPTMYDDNYFNLIYCISLFSHFSEDRQLVWLRELRRISDDKGLLILTVHGKHAYSVMTERADIRERMGVSEQQLKEADEKLAAGEYAFIKQNNSYIDVETYGFTFIPKEYVYRSWSTMFEVLDIRERVIDDWQDAVILRPREIS